MIAIIKCKQCGDVIGKLEKPEITEEDKAKYCSMCDCDAGHKAVELVVETQGEVS